jgi:hypothetical protein
MVQLPGVIKWTLILSLTALAQAQSQVDVPAGTKIALRFINRMDSATAVPDQRVDFRVATHGIVNRRIVIREGTEAHGIVVAVVQDASSASDLRTRIAFIETTAVDGNTVRLARVEITPAALRQVNDPIAAVPTTPVGSILVGNGVPLRSLIRDGQVSIPAGALLITATTHSLQIMTE